MTNEINTDTMTKENNIKLAYELRELVSPWVQTFNYIQIDVLKLVAEHVEGSDISEYIRQPEYTFDDVAEYSKLTAAQLKRKYKIVDHCPEYEQMREEKEQNNYPMWNTCFEFKEHENVNTLKLAEAAGFGVIEGLGDFNPILFVAGAGYSFMASHWIPFYLSLPWNKETAKKYAGVDYSMM